MTQEPKKPEQKPQEKPKPVEKPERPDQDYIRENEERRRRG